MCNIDITEKRDVYYIYRAMHDATCPRCGHSEESFGDDRMGLACPGCGFSITPLEIVKIKGFTQEVLQRRLNSFEVFRTNINIISQGE